MTGRRCALALAAVALALGPPGCAKHASSGYVPGLGELMTLNQMRHVKLWRAAQAGNWPLASYELVPKIVGQPLRELRAAVDAKDSAAFAKAYDALTAGCNSCHRATNFGFNVVKRPDGTEWFADQEFAPPR